MIETPAELRPLFEAELGANMAAHGWQARSGEHTDTYNGPGTRFIFTHEHHTGEMLAAVIHFGFTGWHHGAVAGLTNGSYLVHAPAVGRDLRWGAAVKAGVSP